jgi:hypothetical protein
LDIFVDFSIKIDEHDEWNNSEDNESAPVKVHCIDRRSSHFGWFKMESVVQCFVRHWVEGVVVNHGGFKEPKETNSRRLKFVETINE